MPPRFYDREPYVLNLGNHGFIEGLILKDKNTQKPFCYYFGGIPYAKPPTDQNRWRKPRELEPCYSYGTKASPGKFTGQNGICPQSTSELRRFTEDCLQCAVWVPIDDPPEEGWPVYFYIHGGFLQFGDSNTEKPFALLAETPCKAVIVKPGYRLGIFGFLSSELLVADKAPGAAVGNFGFWDLRMALEWTHKNCSYFHGNADNITVGGYSAGGYATFHQLAHELLMLPPEKRIIKRVIMHSNGHGMPPKSLQETASQLKGVLFTLRAKLGFSYSLMDDPVALFAHLRTIPSKNLIEAVELQIYLHQFRPVADGKFIHPELFPMLRDGRFAKILKEQNVKILIGENSQEHYIYAKHKPAKDGGKYNLIRRFSADYPPWAALAVIEYYDKDGRLPQENAPKEKWRPAFGHIYAIIQIHASQRWFVDMLAQHGASYLVKRYHIDFRSSSVNPVRFDPSYGATHGADLAIWFFGNGRIIENEDERPIMINGLLNGFTGFLKNGDTGPGWGDGHKIVRRLNKDGKVDLWKDEWYDNLVEMWKEIDAHDGPLIDRAKL